MIVFELIGLYLVVASVIGLIPATLARSKGRSFSQWWAISVLFAGIFTVIPVALLRVHRCPECREVVNPEATRCPHCHSVIAGRIAATRSLPVGPWSPAEELFVFWMVIFLGVLAAVAVGVAAFVSDMSTPGAMGLTAGVAIVVGAALTLAVRQRHP